MTDSLNGAAFLLMNERGIARTVPRARLARDVQSWSHRPWIRWGAIVVLVLALALALRHSLWATGCRTAMVEQPLPEPALWRRWPLLSGQAGYEVVDLDPYRDPGLTSARPHSTGDARLAGHGVCAERGASVQSWFGQYFTAVTGDDWTIRLRQEPASGVVLVTGERRELGSEPIPPVPIVAFRVERDGPLRSFWRVVALPLLTLALLILMFRRLPGARLRGTTPRSN